MHPRNPYFTKKPDFAALSKNHVFLAPFVSIVKGKGHIDFKNKDALRALSRALLMEDFKLDVMIPLDSLVPVIPQRLNYILWIEDIFQNTTKQLRGLDIGTGGTAIYALLCARKNNWKMAGTDILQESIDFAKKNIERNGLGDLVDVRMRYNTSTNVFFAELEGKFHFSICNPPFFSSEEETESLGKSRKLGRPPPSAVKTGISTELVAKGGEIEFLSTMITESKQFSSVVGIFTTMVGIKSDLKFLEDFLKVNGVKGYCTTSFVQGKTMRWGLAWTFDSEYAPLLVAATPAPAPKSRAPVKWEMSCKCSMADFSVHIKHLLARLEFKFIVNDPDAVEIIGETNTWSNQRRKRRAAAGVEDCTKRMKSEDSTEGAPIVSDTNFPSANFEDFDGKPYVVHCYITFEENELKTTKLLLVKHLGGTLGIDAVHQVVQYLRNTYLKHVCVQ